jgi:hypothetical protein
LSLAKKPNQSTNIILIGECQSGLLQFRRQFYQRLYAAHAIAHGVFGMNAQMDKV